MSDPSMKSIEECAGLIEPKGPRPCDCQRCTCHNQGDAEAVAIWDALTAAAKTVRNLPQHSVMTTAAPSERAGDEYQPRTALRLVEILKAQNENPRSWQREAAGMLAALATHSDGADGWRDISTAPRDGMPILAIRRDWWTPVNGNHRWVYSAIRQTSWLTKSQRFDFCGEKQPTHWQPLPLPPSSGEG